MTSAETDVMPTAGFDKISAPGKVALLIVAAACVGLSIRLWPQWRHNPDLSHGLFMPIVFLVLLHEARSGPQRFLAFNAANAFSLIGCVLAGLLALATAGLYAASVDWSHALVNLMLALSLALFLTGGLIVFANRSIRLIPFNWTAIVAAGLWLLTVPIPPGTYTRLTLTLQLWVSEAVLRSLHVLGIAAVRHGNIIDLANASVGVEEACSGVRSLVSCIFAAVFFSATLVRRTWARGLILALAAPLALVMNFLRSLTLTLLANNGVDISGNWHDLTGFAVLGVTAGLLGTLAVLLERRASNTTLPATISATTAAPRSAQWILSAGVLSAAALTTFFIVNTRPSLPAASVQAPDLFSLLPEQVPGWEVGTANLYAFSGTLQTEHLAQRNYVLPAESDRTEIIIYVAYWRPGQASVSLVASHTPDACWPGSGWTAVPTGHDREQLTVARHTLPTAEHRLFQADSRPQHVWFWHLYDGKPITYRDPYSAIELLRIAWRYGFRREAPQLFVRVSSNRPWPQIANEPVLTEFFARMRPLGL